MPSSVPGRQIAGFLFTSVAGTLLHFLFDITGQSLPAALISAVNESIWEHMKLLFYPMVLFAWLECRSAGKQETGFWCRKLKSILLGLTLIPVVYYTYTGILGVSADWFNIAIFFLAAGAAYRWEALLARKGSSCRISDRIALTVLVAIGLLFTLVTFSRQRFPSFRIPLRDPMDSKDKEEGRSAKTQDSIAISAMRKCLEPKGDVTSVKFFVAREFADYCPMCEWIYEHHTK